jgi:hypothetical protein
MISHRKHITFLGILATIFFLLLMNPTPTQGGTYKDQAKDSAEGIQTRSDIIASITNTLKPSGKIGGSITCLTKQGNFVYMGWGARMLILDVSALAPNNPPLVASSTPVLPGVISHIEVVGNYAYLATRQAGLRIWDISNPGFPAEIGFFTLANTQSTFYVQVQGNYAYLLQGYSAFDIVNISNPASPELVSRTDLPNGTARAFKIVGNHLYVANGGSLVIYDVTNKATPDEIGTLTLPDNDVDDIVVDGNFAYLEDVMKGLVIVNISTPTNPALVSTYVTSWTGDGITKQGNYIYAAKWRQGIEIIDVSDPLHPQSVTSFNSGGDNIEVVTDNKYAYVACELIGLCIWDISVPAQPQVLGLFKLKPTGVVKAVAQQGTYLYFTKSENGLGILDLTDPEFKEIGAYPKYADNYFTANTLNLAVNGDLAYLGQCQNIQIVNIAVPQNITPVGNYPLSGCPYFLMTYQEQMLIVYDPPDKKIKFIDVSSPGSPSLIADFSFGTNEPGGMVWKEHSLYYVSTVGLHIIDFKDIHHPEEIGFLANSDNWTGLTGPLAVTNGFAYIRKAVGANAYLEIIDIRDPHTPKAINSIPTLHESPIVIEGNFLYTGGFYRLQVYDISIGSAPFLIAEIPIPDEIPIPNIRTIVPITINSTHLFLANSQAGVVIIPIEGKIHLAERLYLPYLEK